MNKNVFDVLIVGAGPVGLALAKGLAQDGRSVLILEKKSCLSEHSKAATVWPGTQEVLNRLNVLSSFEDQSLIVKTLKLIDADSKQESTLLELPLLELKERTPFPRLLIIPQDQTERLLYDSLKQLENVQLRFSAEVKAIKDLGDRVEAEYSSLGIPASVRSRFLIGCDGAHSTVRQSLNLHLDGETYPIKAALADVELISPNTCSGFRISTKNQPYVGIEIGKNRWRLILLVKTEIDLDLKSATEQAVKELFGEVAFKTLWQSEFKLHRRTASQFSKGNIVLAGDAAHLNSPLGGQGMNAGIQDTETLRRSLETAFKENSNCPLQSYSEQRRASVLSGVNRNTGLMTSFLLLDNGKFLKFFLKALSLILKVPWIRQRFLLNLAMLSASYQQ